MSSSSSKQQTTTANTTNNVSRNLNVQDVEGVTVADNAGPVTIVQSDAGAISAGESIAREGVLAGSEVARNSLTAVRDVSEASLDFGSESLDFADRAGAKAFDFAGRAFDFSEDSTGRALSLVNEAGNRQADALGDAFGFGERVLEGSSDFARDLFGKSLDAVSGVLKEGQAQLGNTVTALNTIARQQSTSTDERIQSVAENALKYGLIAVALIVAGIIVTRYGQ